jgi:hypothetical protein
MRIEERQLLLAVHGIVSVVDVEHDVPGRRPEAAAVEIDQAEPDPRQRAPVRRVLEPRQRRLAHQIGACIGAAAAGNLQGGIGLERISAMRARAMSA